MTFEEAAEIVRQAGYTVEPPDTIHDKLLRRMESFASEIQVIDGMLKRGAVLPIEWRAGDGRLLAIRRYAERLFDALAEGRACVNAWDRSEKP